VRIGYDTPWWQVEAMLLEAAARTPGLLQEPPPFVLEKQLRTFSVEYEINAHCDNPQAMESLYSAMHRNILDIFNEYGVQIMTPAYVADPVQAKFVIKDRWYTATAISNSPAPEAKAAALASGKNMHETGLASWPFMGFMETRRKVLSVLRANKKPALLSMPTGHISGLGRQQFIALDPFRLYRTGGSHESVKDNECCCIADFSFDDCKPICARSGRRES